MAAARVDYGRTAGDYGRYRHGFPEALFERLVRYGVGVPGQRVLDLGTGTGTLARGFARVGCDVFGLDLAGPMLEEAERLDCAGGVAVRYVRGQAEEPSFAAGTFDVVTAGQCWHWFERAKVAQEARRLLAPGGRLVIAYYDWLPLPGNVVAATEELILRHNPTWNLGGRNGFHPECLRDAATAGFVDLETFTFDVSASYTHERWRGRVRASAGVAASLSAKQVHAFDAELRRLLAERFPNDSLDVAHRVFAMICRPPT